MGRIRVGLPGWTNVRVSVVILFALAALLALAACSGPAVVEVVPGSYTARVPSVEQFATEAAAELPGGFAPLRDGGVDGIGVRIAGDVLTFSVDGVEITERRVEERRRIADAEGSGPFKADKEILLLGPEPLEFGPVTIHDPVIWPGQSYASQVIALKSFDSDDRGPVSCGPDELCLLLSSGDRPEGRYEDGSPTELHNPIQSIGVSGPSAELVLNSGIRVPVNVPQQPERRVTAACGLSENPVWDVPAGVGLPMDEPVLVYTACPTNPGNPWLMIMDRADIPVLAPIDGRMWCDPADPDGDCLLFLPVMEEARAGRSEDPGAALRTARVVR